MSYNEDFDDPITQEDFFSDSAMEDTDMAHIKTMVSEILERLDALDFKLEALINGVHGGVREQEKDVQMNDGNSSRNVSDVKAPIKK